MVVFVVTERRAVNCLTDNTGAVLIPQRSAVPTESTAALTVTHVTLNRALVIGHLQQVTILSLLVE